VAHTFITIALLRRLLIVLILGSSTVTGISATTTTAGITDTEQAAGPAVGPIGTGSVAAQFAHAEGIALAGSPHRAAHPTVSTATGIRIATEPQVHTGSALTAHGVSVSATVLDGHTAAHATIADASYGRHALGRIAVHCRDGQPIADRTGTTRLSVTTTVHYGQIRGTRVTGATVLVLGPGDRAIRVISVGAVSCSAVDTHNHSPKTSTTSPSSPRERRMIPRAPARLLQVWLSLAHIHREQF
jgi:hypothetical protein